MESYQVDDLQITLNKDGAREYTKVSYPIRYGRFSEIRTPDLLLQFNLNGEIKYVQGCDRYWPHPQEWLKRTIGDDWVYYSAANYKEAYDLLGEYYLPCLSYPSNAISGDDPFHQASVNSAIVRWKDFQKALRERGTSDLSENLQHFLNRVIRNDSKALKRRASTLRRLIGEKISVLPPDTRHVDYEVIPIIVADGCLYHCGFCRVKSGQDFSPRTHANILDQIESLKQFYGLDLPNYNALFLAQHDALLSGEETLLFAATTAYELFQLGRSHMKDSYLFLFGSVASLNHSKGSLFQSLNDLPFSTYINIGLESPDPVTLKILKKPITPGEVEEAFGKMLDINRKFERIEVTANFIFGNELPETHFSSLAEWPQKKLNHFCGKGAFYLSPWMKEENQRSGRQREILRRFNQVKTHALLPTYLYLIQRM